jgi:hypothetical protein
MMLNTGNRHRVVLMGSSGNRTVRSLRVRRKDYARIGSRPHISQALRLLNRAL